MLLQTQKITKNTYSMHWYDASWYSTKQRFRCKIKVMLNKLTFGLFGKILKKRKNNYIGLINKN